MGRSFQNLRLFGELSVLDNVLLGRHSRMTNGFWVSLLGLPGAREQERLARVRARELIAMVGLSHWPTRRPAACPTACSGAWSWRARWRPSPRCCCWTNPPPA